MKRIAQMALLLGLLGLSAQAKVLVISRDGTSVWAERVEAQGDSMKLVGAQSGSGVLPKSAVESVLESVERGRTYMPKEIADRLKQIDAALRHRPNLRKQLDPLRAEWAALERNDAADLSTEIAGLVAAFSATADYAEWKAASAKLAMLKYRDLQKQHGEAIAQADRDLLEKYMSRASARIRALVNSTPKLHGHAREVIRLAADMAHAEPEDSRTKEAAAIRDKEVAAAEAAIVASAAGVFDRGRSITGYLAARAQLREWQRLLPPEDPRIAVAETHLASLLNTIQKTLPAYDLRNHGFPFTREDFERLKTGQAGATLLKPSEGVDEIAFLYPLAAPAPLAVGTPSLLPMRLIFNERPPMGSWCIRILLLVGGGGEAVDIPVQVGTTGEAVDIKVALNLKALAAGLAETAGRNPNAVGQLLYRPGDEGDWQPRSWYFPLQLK